MSTKIQTEETITLLCVVNRLNITHVNNIKKHLLPLSMQRELHIILDLRYVQFMDCSAINCIISINRIAELHHTLLTLSNLTGNIRLMADILHLSKIMNIETHTNHNATHPILQDLTKETTESHYGHLFRYICHDYTPHLANLLFTETIH